MKSSTRKLFAGLGFRIVVFALLLCVILALSATIMHPCRFNLLGQWSVAVVQGQSPISFEVPAVPTLSCLDVTDCPASFVADPFLFKLENSTRWYLFFEVMNEKSDNGDIGIAFSDSALEPHPIWSYQQIILDEPFHLSYPFVFENKGEVYMVPETNEANSVRLYRAIKFPTHWEHVRNLLEGKPYIDSSLLFHEGLWYMWTYTLPSRLELFVSNSLSDTFRPHPNSPIYEHNTRLARPGGRPIEYNGSVLRFAQDCTNLYGERVVAIKVSTLTSQHYQEQEIKTIKSEPGLPWISQRTHHVDAHFIGGAATPGGGGRERWLISVDGNSTRHRDFTVFVWSVILAVCLWLFIDIFIGIATTRCYHTLFLKIKNNLIRRRGYSLLINGGAGGGGRNDLKMKKYLFRIAVAITAGGMLLSFMRVQTPRETHAIGVEGLEGGGWADRLDTSPGELERECGVTLVMALFDIGRETAGGESRKWGTYLEYFNQVLELDMCCVVRVNEREVDFVREHRRGQEHKTHIVVDSVANMKGYKHYTEMQNMIDHPPPDFLKVRPGRPEKKIVEYNVVMFSKIDWLKQAVDENVFNSSAFFWIDAGYGHGLYLDKYRGQVWPNPKKLEKVLPKTQIIQVKVGDFERSECDNIHHFLIEHRIIFAGGFFGGFAGPVQRAYKEYHKALESELSTNMMDDDQTPWLDVYCSNPDLIKSITCPTPLVPFALYCSLVGQQPCMTHRRYNCPATLFAP